MYKLIKQTDLNKIESSRTDTNADGRRATKYDIQSVTSQLLTSRKENGERREENGEVKASLERVEKVNGEMRKEKGEIKSTLTEIRSDNSEMKLTLEKLVSMLSK